MHNVGELIALMKSAKEPFQVATPGAGTVNFLASVLFAQQAGVKVEQIIEKGSGPLVTDMMGGFVKVGFNPIPASRAGLDGGYIRALAVTSAKHSTLMPNLPTLAESGLPGFDATLSYGLLAPAGTPQPIVQKLNKALNEALAGRRGAKAHHQRGCRTGAGNTRRSSRRHRSRGNQVGSGHPVGRLAAEVNGSCGSET